MQEVSKMTTLTLAVPDEMKKKMDSFPEMNWSEVARQAFMQKIGDMEFLRKFKEKTERTAEELFRLVETLKRRIVIVPLEELVHHVEEAERLTPDPDDMAYFALALKLNCAIWSNDKQLKEQNKIKVYHTHELSKISGHP